MIDYNKKDWKYLLILDACRFDSFEKVIKGTSFEGKLLKADSGAMQTPDWYKLHWQKPAQDIVLISDNPQPFSQRASGNVAKKFVKSYASWKGELDPESALKTFTQVKEPEYRYLIHLLPPHLPFFGKRGHQFMKKLLGDKITPFGAYRQVQDYAQHGHWKEVREYYEENVEFGLNLILKYLNYFEDGKLVITADHGEMIGEGTAYAHHSQNKDDITLLRTVPWYEVDVDQTLVNKRLEELGY